MLTGSASLLQPQPCGFRGTDPRQHISVTRKATAWQHVVPAMPFLVVIIIVVVVVVG